MSDVAAEAPDLGESALYYQIPLGGPEDVRAWIENASPGDTCIYFIGHLAVARDMETRPFGRPMAEKAGAIADLMLEASDSGKVRLTQKKQADGCYWYGARRVFPSFGG